jgi:hypothetical protein
MADNLSEYQNMQEEIREFNAERERIKHALGSIGGTFFSKADMVINIGILAVIVTFFVLEVAFHLIPAFLSLEIGIFLVSVKIVLMIHAQQKTSHFQFWMLNTIEFRINKMEREVAEMKRRTDREPQ